MRTNLLITILTVFLMTYFAAAQVTKLSNNTSLTGAVFGNKVIMTSEIDNTLWTTNGTAAGTFRYANNVVFDSSGDGVILGDKVIFAGLDASHGSELWTTDGTAAGTNLIKDILPGTNSSAPRNFSVHNDLALFFDSTANGVELWKTDGTEAGTVLLKDINPGPGNSIDGDFFVHFFYYNGISYFFINNATQGLALWKTDGTSGGTVLVKVINSASTTSFFFADFVLLGNTVLFTVDDGTHGQELWKTDGTANGTVMVKDINAGLAGSSPSGFLLYKNKLYFNADNGTNGAELWTTDGTTAGTTLVKDINPGLLPSFPLVSNAIIFGDKFLFLAYTTANGTELWSSDGTAAGTSLFKDINAGAASSNPIILLDYASESPNNTLFNNKIFLTATTEANGNELWITDGTAAGTTLVKDIFPGTEDGVEFSHYYTKNAFYFSGQSSEATGYGLWKSDGTAAGTTLVKDINPTAESSEIQFLFIYNNQLYLSANDGDNTSELLDLYKVDESVEPLPISLLDFTAVLHTKSVQLNWRTSTEINSSHFIVERSTDGIRFESLDKVDAKGNSTQLQNYSYDDNKAYGTGAATLFYRLQQVDKDGTFKYSAILPVRLKDALFEMSISPNPVQDQLNVNFTVNGAQKIMIRIVDLKGNSLYQQSYNAGQTSYQHNISITNLPTGMYYLQLITGKEKKSIPFIKQ